MIESLRGMDKELISTVESAVARGWTWKLTSNNHVLMHHPGGGSVLVPVHRVSPRNLKNTLASIRRVERAAASRAPQPEPEPEPEPVPQVGWHYYSSPKGVGFERRACEDAWEYRCVICGVEGFKNLYAAAGHMKKHRPAPVPVPRDDDPIREEPVAEPPPAAPAGPVPPKPQIQPLSLLTQRIAALLQEELEAFQEEINTLRVENKRLKETLTTLAQLAAEG